MDGIVWWKGMACKRVQQGLRVRQWESPSGQRETVIYPRMLMVPLDSSGEQGPPDWVSYDRCDVDLEDLERRADQAAKRSARRARQNCRRKIKHAGLNEMLTLTYRENMTDLKRMRRDLAAWLRIMRRVIKGFRAVYGIERQKRGAWHVHIATDKLPKLMQYKGAKVQSWKVGTAVWRSVVPTGGMCFVGGRKGRFNRAASPAKIAAYIAGYLTKDNAAGEAGARMWDSTRDLTPPPAITMDFPDAELGDLIPAAFALPAGHQVVSHRMNAERDLWVLYTEPIPPIKTAPLGGRHLVA